jgi:hypothetical protein
MRLLGSILFCLTFFFGAMPANAQERPFVHKGVANDAARY